MARYQIEHRASDKTKSELYIDLLPLIMSQKVELLDHPRMIAQLLNLERRVGRSGKDSVSHPPRQHDDLINAVAGVLTMVAGEPRQQVGMYRSRWLQ